MDKKSPNSQYGFLPQRGCDLANADFVHTFNKNSIDNDNKRVI